MAFHQQTSEVTEGMAHLNFVLNVTVENTSLQSATAWGVHIKNARREPDYRWQASKTKQCLIDGVCVRAEQTTLLPSEKVVVSIHVRGSDKVRMRSAMNFCDLADAFCVTLRPVTQDFVGKEIQFRIDRSEVHAIRRNIEDGLF